MQIESENYVLEDPQFGTNSNSAADTTDQVAPAATTTTEVTTHVNQPKRFQISRINALLGAVVVLLFIIWFFVHKNRSN